MIKPYTWKLLRSIDSECKFDSRHRDPAYSNLMGEKILIESVGIGGGSDPVIKT
jgi:hypothetical protein